MSNEDRLATIQHGAIVMLIGLLFGFATMLQEEPVRFWHTAHETTVFIGIMLLAVSAVLPALRLERWEARALMRSIHATAYGLPAGLLIQAVIGEHAFSPTTDPVRMFAFLCNITGMGGSVFLASLTLMGARGALRVTGGQLLMTGDPTNP